MNFNDIGKLFNNITGLETENNISVLISNLIIDYNKDLKKI